MAVAQDNLPEAIYSADQVRALDRIAIDELGIPGYELMCRAGQAALEALERRWPEARALHVFCGAGNNAGDGYVLARLAADRGYDVLVSAVVSPDKLSGDAQRAWAQYRDGGGITEPFPGEASFSPDVIADALLGTGLDRSVEGAFADAVAFINQARAPVLALDIPSGLHADTGFPLGPAVHADATVSFVGLKQGLFLGASPDYRGELEFAGLGVPEGAYEAQRPVLLRLSLQCLRDALPPRRHSSHKGSHGNLLLVGGGLGMPGAIRLAAEAALRAGAGLVRVATHPANVPMVMAGRAEIMCRGVASAEALDELIGLSDGIVLGPGLGTDAWARGLWQKLLDTELPLVLDADGLNLLAAAPRARGRWILTPHPGEAARLLDEDPAVIQRERLASVRRLAERYAGVAVLKGAGTLVAAPHATVSVCHRGNPGMASAGMGDVLSGILGALLVQTGGDLTQAARAGVLLHALAGDGAAAQAQRGTLAGDLMAHIRRWANPV